MHITQGARYVKWKADGNFQAGTLNPCALYGVDIYGSWSLKCYVKAPTRPPPNLDDTSKEAVFPVGDLRVKIASSPS